MSTSTETFKVGDQVYFDNADTEFHLRPGRVTGVRPGLRLGRITFADDVTIPFKWHEAHHLPDNTTHHLVQEPTVGGTPTCRYCHQTLLQLKAGHPNGYQPTRWPCPVAFLDATGMHLNVTPVPAD